MQVEGNENIIKKTVAKLIKVEKDARYGNTTYKKKMDQMTKIIDDSLKEYTRQKNAP